MDLTSKMLEDVLRMCDYVILQNVRVTNEYHKQADHEELAAEQRPSQQLTHQGKRTTCVQVLSFFPPISQDVGS